MLLQGVDLRKCGGVKPIVVVHGSQRVFTANVYNSTQARRENLPRNRVKNSKFASDFKMRLATGVRDAHI
jgi:hypothetical protein